MGLLTWIRGKSTEAQGRTVQFTAPVELVAAQGEGKRPTFAIVAYTGVPMNVAGFYYPVVIDLGGLKASRQNIPVLLDHELTRIVGQTDMVQITSGRDGQVVVTGAVTGDDADAAKVVVHAKNGFQWQASVGATVTRREFLEAGHSAEVNGNRVAGPAIIAREAVLHEVSFTALGADSQSSASVAAQQPQGTEQTMTFEQWLTANGWDIASLSAPQLTTLRAAFDRDHAASPATVSVPTAPASPIQAAAPSVLSLADVRAEHARIATIEQVCGGNHNDIRARAIGEGWTSERAELEVLRADRGRHAPQPFFSDDAAGRDNGRVLEAALCIAGRLPDAQLVQAFGEQTLNTAEQRFGRAVTLQRVLLEAAWAGGYSERHFPSGRGLRELLRAAFSTYSLPGHFSNTANKFMLAGFMHVESVWRRIATTRGVNDFKQITSYRLTGAQEFQALTPAGKLVHGTLGEESFTNQARTYGIVLGIKREDIINDDLGALTQVPQRIGRGGALKLNDVFWTAFLDNSTFFASGNNNYFDGAATNLQSSSLQTAVQKFRKQTDPDGKPLGTEPKLLLIPPEEEVTADELYTSTHLIAGGGSSVSKQPSRNVFMNKYEPIVSAYLSNSGYTGYSTTAWYLLADPADLSAIEVAFLNNVQQPFVETADADFEELGIQMRGYFDFGVAKQDYRAGVKSKGAA